MTSRTFRYVLVAAALAALLAAPAAGQVKDYRKIKHPPLPEFKIPKPEIYTLDNGITVFLLENHELPLIEVEARIRTGSVYEPADKAGLAGITGQAQREGGTQSMSGDEIDEFLADRDAFVETGVGQEVGFASMDCLRDDFDDVFKLFHDVLRHPVFAEDKIEVAKTQANSGIARRNDDVGQITSREFRRLVYGEDSPLARNTEYATISAITRDDLVAWHKKYYHPNSILLGVVGDFDSEPMKQKIEATFGSWPKGPAFNEPEVDYKQQEQGGVYFIPKEDVTQANVRMGHLGISTRSPDYFAVQVMNEVLGGSFASRLFSNVRSEKGLAYSVFGSVGSAFDHPGICQVGLQTKSETMAEAVEALKEEVTGIINNPPTDEELTRAKDSILNSFVFNYASKSRILNQQMTYAYYGMPADFLEQYRSNIEKVTRADTARVAKEYIHPDKVTLLVVGKAEDFDRPVSTFGKVTAIDISIPPMPDTAPQIEKTAASLEAGSRLMAATAAKLGGETLAKTKAIRSSSTLAVNFGGQSMALSQSVVEVFPDKAHVVLKTPMGDQTVVLNGDQGFMIAAGQTRPMPSAMLEDQKKNLARDLQHLLRYADAPDLQAVAGGEETIDGAVCRVLAVSYKGADSRLWIGTEDKVVKQSYQGQHPMTRAPGTMEIFFSDYREIEGMLVPHKEVMLFNGDELATITLESFEVNPEIDDSLFESPSS